MTSRTLYLFGSAAPPVFDVAGVIESAQAQGWDVCLGLTPTAARWLGGSLSGLAALTGHPVRSEYKLPGEPDVWPAADVIAMAPATFNTVNAWALGLTGRFVVGVAAEAIGRGVPLVAMPCVNTAYARHPAFERSMGELRLAGVNVLHDSTGSVPQEPGQDSPAVFPWHLLLSAVNETAG